MFLYITSSISNITFSVKVFPQPAEPFKIWNPPIDLENLITASICLSSSSIKLKRGAYEW